MQLLSILANLKGADKVSKYIPKYRREHILVKNRAKNKAYLTLLIAENQRIITNFAAQAKKNIEISGCAKREHRDFQRAKLLIIITYTQVSQRPGGSPIKH